MLPIVYDNAVNERGWSWPDIVRRTATSPHASSASHPAKARSTVGADADIVLYDPRAESTVTRDGLLTNQRWSAFEGRTVRGRVVRTLVRGQDVYRDGEIVVPAGFGRFLTPEYARCHRGACMSIPSAQTYTIRGGTVIDGTGTPRRPGRYTDRRGPDRRGRRRTFNHWVRSSTRTVW